MSFKEKRILMNKFVESEFEVTYLYEFPRKANSSEDISWVLVWSNLSLRVSKNSNRDEDIVETESEVMYVYEFETKSNSYEDICWVSVWSYVNLWVSNQSKF